MHGTILVVEDNQDLAEMVTDFLRAEGFRVETASNGSVALTMLEHLRPTLILSDVWMPRLSGIALARTLRARGDTTPILFMSAAGQVEAYAEEAGVAWYIHKPFLLDELLTLIEHIIEVWHEVPMDR